MRRPRTYRMSRSEKTLDRQAETKTLTTLQQDKADSKARQLKYVHGIPRKPLPRRIVLVHNHVIPQKTLGMNGFRAWTEKLNDRLEVCACDWAGVDLRGLTHYRYRLPA